MNRAARFVSRLVRAYHSLKLSPTTFLNVNLPPDNGHPYRKYQFTRQGDREYKDVVIRKYDPRGRDYYWIGGHPRWKRIKGTDFMATRAGLVSITPMQLAFTDTEALYRLGRLPVDK